MSTSPPKKPSTIPLDIILVSQPFPIATSSTGTGSSPSPVHASASHPSVSYHFTPTDGPLDPRPLEGERILVWDVESGTVSSLGDELVAKGGARKEEDGVWVIDVVEQAKGNAIRQGGMQFDRPLEDLLAMLKRQEELLAAISGLQNGP